MSDPIKDLENFDSQGLAVNPLPPSDVRRQGDALRRRRNAGMTVAAAAAVAAIITPIALVSGSGDNAAPEPTEPSNWVTTIPDDFPLTIDMPREDWDGTPVAMTDDLEDGIPVIDVCGETLFSTEGAADAASTRYGGEGAGDVILRTLTLRASDTEATKVMDDAAAALAACPGETIGGLEHVYGDQFIPLAEQSLIYSDRIRTEGGFDPGVGVTGLARVGNAVVVTKVWASFGGDSGKGVGETVADVVQSLQILTGEMCLFSESPCAAGTGQQVGEAPSDIPDEFPLNLRQRAMVGDGGVDLAPSEDVDGIRWEQICGAPIWTGDYLHRIGSMGTGPEFADTRELRTYVSADEASIQMEDLRTAVLSCPTYANQVMTMHKADTGYHSITWSRTYSDGLGGQIFQATRVGRAILVTVAAGETSLESIPDAIPETTSLTKDIAQEMCVFTEDGCTEPGGTELSEADLIVADETQPRYESGWDTVSTLAGEGDVPASPCFGNTFAGRGATSVFRRDFEMNGPEGPMEGNRLTAVVAEFPDEQTAQAAWIGFGEDAGLCEEKIVPEEGSEYQSYEGGEVQLENVDGLARTWFAEFGPHPGGNDTVYRLETGVAMVGNRIVVLTSIYGPFEPGGPPNLTTMKAMMVQASERLLPGPEGSITEPPIMP